MAKKKTADQAEKAGEPQKKSKKKLIIMVVAVLAIAGGVYKFVLAPKPKPAPPAAGEVVKMDPTIVNLSDGHYLKVGFNIVLVEGKATAEKFDSSEAQQMIINQFSGRSRATMTTEMRTKLEEGLKKQIVSAKDYKGEVFDIFYNQFLID